MSNCPDVTLSPSLPVILNEVNNLMAFRTGSAKGFRHSSVAESTLSQAEVFPQNDTGVNGYYLILASIIKASYNSIDKRGVAQLVARSVRDAEVGGSSPLAPISSVKE